MKPRNPPATAPAVTSVSSSAAALQSLQQGLIFTWGHITVSGASGLRELACSGKGLIGPDSCIPVFLGRGG